MLAYLVNIHPNGDISSFFLKQGIKINADDYATGIMLRWIFRSRLRNGGKGIVFLTSIRMRKLLQKWMDHYRDVTDKKIDELFANL